MCLQVVQHGAKGWAGLVWAGLSCQHAPIASAFFATDSIMRDVSSGTTPKLSCGAQVGRGSYIGAPARQTLRCSLCCAARWVHRPCHDILIDRALPHYITTAVRQGEAGRGEAGRGGGPSRELATACSL